MQDEDLLKALAAIDVSTVSYSDWIKVGQALKTEGFSCDVWEDWSRNDVRFHPGECQRKWNTFNGASNPVKAGSIFDLAKTYGYDSSPFAGKSMCMEWDDVIEYDGTGIGLEIPTSRSQTEQLLEYLELLFKPDDIVSYVTNDVWLSPDNKWMPARGVYNRTARELTESLKKYPDDLGATIGDWKEECGAWIRFNPVDGKGIKNDNITRFDYALVESDSMPISEQDAMYRRLELPIVALVNSGGKSLHAIVRVDACDYGEYRKRVDFLYAFLEKNGLVVDKQNRNPSRLSRMPGVTREGREQTLIATNIGRSSWVDWIDYAEGYEDNLPPLTTLKCALKQPIELPEELIEGVLRKGHKMIITGSSKAGKSFLMMELALAISSGRKWLNFNCKKGKVLYVNLEIDPMSCINRFKTIMEELHMSIDDTQNLSIWNLRGNALPLNELAPKIVRRLDNQNYTAVIIDPIYKVITGDENNASDMGKFCNQFDLICSKLGCSTIYCHHHSKGSQGQKNMMDRGSGSGVFARDPDAIIDLIELELSPGFVLQNGKDEFSTGWQIEGTLREFRGFKPIKVWFDYPTHRVDDIGILDCTYAKGSVDGNFSKSGKRQQTPESRFAEFEMAFQVSADSDGSCTTRDMADFLGVGIRTIQKRVKEFSENYILSNGRIYKTNSSPNEYR